jgi:signal transduction histidine kinase
MPERRDLIEIARMVALEKPLPTILARSRDSLARYVEGCSFLILPIGCSGQVDRALLPTLPPHWKRALDDHWGALSSYATEPGWVKAPIAKDIWVRPLVFDEQREGLMLAVAPKSNSACLSSQTVEMHADMAALAIVHARHQQHEQAARRRADRLAEFIRATKPTLPLVELTRITRNAVAESGLFDRVGIFLVSDDRQWVEGCWGTDRDGKEVALFDQRWPRPVTEEDFLWVVANGQKDYILIEDYTATRNLPTDHPMYGVRHHAIMGLKTGTEVVGEICVDNLLSGRPITPEDIENVRPFLDQTALAISNARLIGALEETHRALVRHERMEASIRITAEVAHTLNNILTRLIGAAEFLEEQKDISDEARLWSHRIIQAAEEAATTVHNLQALVRPARTERPPVVQLLEAVNQALSFTEAKFTHCRAEAEVDVPPTLYVLAQRDDLLETLTAVLTNSCEAIQDGGVIRISAGLTSEGKVSLGISDTGTGMPPEVARRAAEPFFSSKRDLGHLGLGLSNAWAAAQRWGGSLSISSRVQGGTTVTLTLPSGPAPH